MTHGDRKDDGRENITRLLHKWKDGDEGARDSLMPLVYDTLHHLANQQFGREQAGHTLQPTALVHEAFLSLENSEIEWQDRQHFYAVAARAMRRILVDHARMKLRNKRGGNRLRVDLTGSDIPAPAPDADILILDDALDRLADHSERTSRILELTYFGGLSRDAVAGVMNISSRTVDRDLNLGRAWLRRRLDASG